MVILYMRCVVLTNQEIIEKWKQGLTKNSLAKIYKREYNLQIKMIRLDIRNRHKGQFISQYEALKHIEKIIYNEVIQKNKNS